MAPSFVFPRVILHAKDFSSATQKKKIDENVISVH